MPVDDFNERLRYARLPAQDQLNQQRDHGYRSSADVQLERVAFTIGIISDLATEEATSLGRGVRHVAPLCSSGTN